MSQIPYTILPNELRGKTYHSLIKVTLNYKKTHKITPVPILALIDSGADVCFCSDLLAVWLGINLDKIKKEETFTAANRTTFQTKSENLTLTVAGKTYECKFFFCNTLPQNTPIILGQLGFFDHFRITFDARNGFIDIS